MNTYKITFEGRLNGAIGKTYKISETVKADNFNAAVLSLYDKYEHIRIRFVNGKPYNRQSKIA